MAYTSFRKVIIIEKKLQKTIIYIISDLSQLPITNLIRRKIRTVKTERKKKEKEKHVRTENRNKQMEIRKRNNKIKSH